MDRAALALDLVASARVLVIDVETTGTHPHKDYVVGWVFATEGISLYLPVRHTGGGNLFDDPEDFEHDLRLAFAKRSRLGLLTVAHNFPFDAWYAGKEGVIVDGPVEDTMLNEVLLNDDLRAYDLEACAARHNVQAKKGALLYPVLHDRFVRRGKPSPKVMEHFHRLRGDDPVAHEYAAGDGTTTFELWQVQQPLLDRDGLRKVHALECSLLPRLARMRRQGIRVDLDWARQANRRLDDDLTARLMLMPPGFDANSTKSVADYLRGEGITNFPKTGKGRDSFREHWLEGLGPVGERVVAIRRLEKTRGTFLTPILNAHAVEGRIHPDLVQFATGDYGTHTGRLSCRLPNLQAYPKRNRTIGMVVRPILIPDDDMVFGEADVSQQEPRLYADYGRDWRLIDGYNSDPPTDMHAIASSIMGISRDAAKTLGLSILNGMKGETLARRLGVTRSEADEMMWRFLQVFPGVNAFRADAPRVARDRGFIRTKLGRRCYFTDPAATYMAVSRIIQGSAADQMKLMMKRAFEYCEATPAVQLLMSIHDSLMFQAQRGFDLSEFKRVLEDNSELNLRVPMPLEMKLGRHWGEASYGEGAYP